MALRVTDDESRRVFHYLRYRSREWSLLNNVTWGSIGRHFFMIHASIPLHRELTFYSFPDFREFLGAALATATCGGYIIITTGLLIAAATGELRGRKTVRRNCFLFLMRKRGTRRSRVS